MNAAARLGAVLAETIGAAADTRWLAMGTVVATDPLIVHIDGSDLPASSVGAVGSVGDPVLLSILRGAPAVSYVALAAVVIPPPPEADYAWLHTTSPPAALSTDGQVYVLNPHSGMYSYAKYQSIHVAGDVPTDPTAVVEVYAAVQYPPDPLTLDPTTLDVWLEAPDGSLYLMWWAGDPDPDWPTSSELELSARFPYTGTAAGYWQMWVCENPAFTDSGAVLHNFALAFTREGGLPL